MFEKTPHTVGRIVADDYRTAALFHRHGIDYCCGGGRTLDEACIARGLDPAAVREELDLLKGGGGSPGADYNALDLADLVEHIVGRHHRYVREAAPVIQAGLHKVARVHGGRHPETIGVAARFDAVLGDLMAHMEKEERMLFPHVVGLARARREGAAAPAAAFGSVRNPIAMMELEHRGAGDEMAEIRNLTGDYTPPDDACTTYRVVYRQLAEFEGDLHLHVHIENNILFPKAIDLESRVDAGVSAGR